MRKKLLLLAVVALATLTSVNAQDKPLSLGVKAGVNLSNFGGKGNDGGDAKVGFNAGLTVDYALTSDLYLLSGLEFTMKGAKYEYTDEVLMVEKANPMYLQLPVHLGYKLAVTEGVKIVFHAGPYVAYGIGGKYKIEAKGTGVSESMDFFGKEEAKSLDYGIGGGVGVEFGKIGAGLGYDFGLANIGRSSEYKLKTQNAYLTVGYKF